MRTQLLSLPGGTEPNEDFALANPNLAIMLDGATCPPDPDTGREHGTPCTSSTNSAHDTVVGGPRCLDERPRTRHTRRSTWP